MINQFDFDRSLLQQAECWYHSNYFWWEKLRWSIRFTFQYLCRFFLLPSIWNFNFFLKRIENQWKNSIRYHFGVVYTIMRQINDYCFDDYTVRDLWSLVNRLIDIVSFRINANWQIPFHENPQRKNGKKFKLCLHSLNLWRFHFGQSIWWIWCWRLHWFSAFKLDVDVAVITLCGSTAISNVWNFDFYRRNHISTIDLIGCCSHQPLAVKLPFKT